MGLLERVRGLVPQQRVAVEDGFSAGGAVPGIRWTPPVPGPRRTARGETIRPEDLDSWVVAQPPMWPGWDAALHFASPVRAIAAGEELVRMLLARDEIIAAELVGEGADADLDSAQTLGESTVHVRLGPHACTPRVRLVAASMLFEALLPAESV